MGKSHGQMSVECSPPQWLRCCLFCTSHDKTRTSGLHTIWDGRSRGEAAGKTDDVRFKGTQILFASRQHLASLNHRVHSILHPSFILFGFEVTSCNRPGWSLDHCPRRQSPGPKDQNAKHGAHHPPAATSALFQPSAQIVNFRTERAEETSSLPVPPTHLICPGMFKRDPAKAAHRDPVSSAQCTATLGSTHRLQYVFSV
jgi:hypothetical protein